MKPSPKVILIERLSDGVDSQGTRYNRFRGTDAATRKSVKSGLYRKASVPGGVRRARAKAAS